MPYSLEYQGELARAAELLREAAGAHPAADPEGLPRPSARTPSSPTTTTTSDVAWMELDASIEPTIGPYEVYEDEWFNDKAAFEAFITVRDDAETREAGALRRPSCRTSRTTCPSTPRCATRSWARSRPSAW